jgi:hypothetical protein
VAALALAALLAGCGGGDEESATQTCTNETFAFTIEYPAGWHTDAVGHEGGECLFFDEQPFDVPENSDFGGTAIEVQPTQQGYEELVRSLTDARFATAVKSDTATVDGRPATRVEAEATGEGLEEAGTRSYAYVVDRDGRGFLLRTTARAGADFGERKRALDRAAQSVRFTGPAPAVP